MINLGRSARQAWPPSNWGEAVRIGVAEKVSRRTRNKTQHVVRLARDRNLGVINRQHWPIRWSSNVTRLSEGQGPVDFSSGAMSWFSSVGEAVLPERYFGTGNWAGAETTASRALPESRMAGVDTNLQAHILSSPFASQTVRESWRIYLAINSEDQLVTCREHLKFSIILFKNAYVCSPNLDLFLIRKSK